MFPRSATIKETHTLFGEDQWTTLLLLLTTFFLLLWALGNRGLWSSEGRWAEVTREMLLTGDFFHPTIGGVPYFDKPLLTYWLIAILSITVGALNEWVVRLPSAISGIVVIGTTMYLGRRLWSAHTGRIAGWILLTTYGFLFWSRTGTAETENLAAIILSITWYWSHKNQPGFKTFLIFYLITFVGALTKGLTAVVVPVLVVLPDILENKQWRILLKPSHVLAFTIAFIIYSAPLLYASMTSPDGYHANGLAMVFRENIVRFFKPFDHQGPFYLYFYSLPVLFMPWAPLFAAALAGMLKTWRSLNHNTRWLIKAVAIIFLFFTASGSRRGYYILPLLPLCALLTAVFLTHTHDSQANVFRRWGMYLQGVLLIILVCGELAAPFIAALLKAQINLVVPQSLPASSIATGLTALILSLLVYNSNHLLSLHLKTNRMISALIVSTTVLLGGYFCWQQNILERYRTDRSFAREIRTRSAGMIPERIGFFPKADANMLFYMNTERPVHILNNTRELHDFLESNQPGVLIFQQRYLAEIPNTLSTALQRYPSLTEKVEPWVPKSSRGEKWIAWFLE